MNFSTLLFCIFRNFSYRFGKTQGVNRSSSKKGDTAASIGSVATLPKMPLPVHCLLGYSQTLIGNGKDGERMANRKRSIVLRVPVTAEERALIEKKMQQISILFRYVIRGAEQDYL